MHKTLVILVNYNSWRDTVECLESLLRTEGRFSVVVCDNGSQDDSVWQITNWAENWSEKDWQTSLPKLLPDSVALRQPSFSIWPEALRLSQHHFQNWLTLIDIGENKGFAGANNVGLAAGLLDDYQYFWLLNNDTVVHPQALTNMLSELHDNPDATVAGGTTVFFHDPYKIQCRAGASFDQRTASSKYIGHAEQAFSSGTSKRAVLARLDMLLGANMLLSRRYLEDVGLMDESYFLYFEEIDWARRAGAQFIPCYAESSIVYHKHGMSIGKPQGKPSSARVKFLFGNMLLVTARHFPQYLLSVRTALVKQGLRLALKGYWSEALQVFKFSTMPAPRTAPRIPEIGSYR